MKRSLFIAVTLLLAGVLAACLGKMAGHEGSIATQSTAIPIKEGGPHEGVWQDENLIVAYRYTLTSNVFTIQGSVELTGRLTRTFTTVQNFAVRTNLLSEERKIARSLVIVTVGNSIIRQWRFNRSAEIPPEVTAMNFSYSGRASEGAGGLGRVRTRNGVSTTFWKNP